MVFRQISGPWCFAVTLLVNASFLASLPIQAVAQEEAALESAFEPSPEQMELLQRYASIEWQEGPTTGKVGDMAEIDVPAGYQFTEAEGAQTLLEIYGNPRNPDILAALLPTDEDADWTLIFQFDDIGYVKDDDREELDADALIGTFKNGIEYGNQQRRAMGTEELLDINWAEKPFYDAETNNLTWALLLKFPSGDSVNYDIRLLGRRGVMEATLVGDPATYSQAVPVVKDLLAGYQFTEGNTYAEWTTGDKVADYGLMGLVAGGATVAAVKTGLFGKLGLLLAKGGKAVIVGICVLGAGILSFFRRLLGGGPSTAEE